jgi:uncharacterized protein YjiS (DUF1127 family)
MELARRISEECREQTLAAKEASPLPTGYELQQAAGAARTQFMREVFIAVVHAVRAFAHRAYSRYRQRREAEAIYDALRQLDDRTLKDLGFDRSEIRSIAAESTWEAEHNRLRVL